MRIMGIADPKLVISYTRTALSKNNFDIKETKEKNDNKNPTTFASVYAFLIWKVTMMKEDK